MQEEPVKTNRALFPPPPVFWKLFTNESKEAFESSDPTDRPIELRCFEPPPIPPNYFKFEFFESTALTDPPPLPPNVPNLFPECEEPRDKLVKLNRLLLKEYLHLLKILLMSKTHPEIQEALKKDAKPKRFNHSIPTIHNQCRRIEHVFNNIQHWFNHLRPFEAREQIIFRLRKQLAARTERAEKLEKAIERYNAIEPKYQEVMKSSTTASTDILS